MLEFMRRALASTGDGEVRRSAVDVNVAACALFLEMACIDSEFSDIERERILQIVQNEFGVERAHAEAIEHEAEEQRGRSADLWRFTNLINTNYGESDRVRVVELLWKVVYADGRVDDHEDYLVHKLAKLLRLTHRQLIDAKLRVLHDGTSKEG